MKRRDNEIATGQVQIRPANIFLCKKAAVRQSHQTFYSNACLRLLLALTSFLLMNKPAN